MVDAGGAPLLFTQARFAAFFLVVFVGHWSLRGGRARKVWLLAASYAFYAAWDWRFLALLGGSSALDFACARGMEGASRAGRRAWLALSLAGSLGALAFFKYCGFFLDSAAALARALGFAWQPGTLALALPLGISFYTFQSMGYVLDVYRGRHAPVRDPLDFALFVAFFPQLGAGPIARGAHFLPQLAAPRRFAAHVDLTAAGWLFLAGFLKKACVADGLAPHVDPLFASPGEFSTTAAWSGLLLYHVQIYCDFSGYTDLARATAGLLGYRLPPNFDFPYLARSIADFWRRWHMSLSSWLRDYLFFPLVGKKGGAGRRRVALVVTMGLCGLWHGAGWPFVAFGTLHGLYLVLEELWRASPYRRSGPGRLAAFLALPALNGLVLLTWPVFRVRDGEAAGVLYRTLLGAAAGEASLDPRLLLVVPLFALAHVAAHAGLHRRVARQLPAVLHPALYGFAWALALSLVADELVPFIYFQF